MTVYSVCYTTGSYEDYRVIRVKTFAVKETAEEHVNYLKKYIEENGLSEPDYYMDEYEHKDIFRYVDCLTGVNNIHIEEIEVEDC